MESATITKVTLRKEKLRSGKLSLYLDYYPPIRNPHTKKDVSPGVSRSVSHRQS